MKLLVDMNLSPSWVERLARHGFEVVHWSIRALVEAIVLEPDGERLGITLKGDSAGMLSAARDTKRSPDTGDLMVQIKLVAGACNRRYLQLSSGSA